MASIFAHANREYSSCLYRNEVSNTVCVIFVVDCRFVIGWSGATRVTWHVFTTRIVDIQMNVTNFSCVLLGVISTDGMSSTALVSFSHPTCQKSLHFSTNVCASNHGREQLQEILSPKHPPPPALLYTRHRLLVMAATPGSFPSNLSSTTIRLVIPAGLYWIRSIEPPFFSLEKNPKHQPQQSVFN